MARFGQFIKEQLMPEDPMDWIIMLLMLSVIIGGIILVMVMYAYGLL